MMNANLFNAVQKFQQLNKWVFVVSKRMLDRYLIGVVQQISPDAPDLVVFL